MKQTERISRTRIIIGVCGNMRNILLGILFVCFFCILAGMNSKKAEAAGAMIDISTKSNTVAKGDTVYVVVTISSTEQIKGFKGYFTYDNRVLKFVTGGSVTHGNDDAFLIDDTERSSSAAKITYSVKFIARNAGSVSISLRKPYHVYADDEDSQEMSVSFNTLNILVKGKKENPTSKPAESAKPKEKSPELPQVSEEPEESKEPEESLEPAPVPAATRNPKDVPGSNQLRKLSIEGVDFAPAFAPNIRKYSAIVTTDDKSLAISYETKDSQAEVVVRGNENLKKGKNLIKLVVRGTDGKKRVYRLSLNIQRLDNELQNHYVTAVKKDGKLYLLGNSEIELLEPEEDSIIPEGFEKEETTIDGKKIITYALKSGGENNFVLIYGKGNKAEWYLYDLEEGLLLPYEKVKSWYRSMNGETDRLVTEEEKTIQSYKYVIGIMTAFCGLMFLIVIYMWIRRRRR